MRSVFFDDFIQSSSIIGPTHHQDFLPKLPGNGFLPEKAVKQSPPAIKSCRRGNGRQSHIDPRERWLELEEQRKAEKSRPPNQTGHDHLPEYGLPLQQPEALIHLFLSKYQQQGYRTKNEVVQVGAQLYSRVLHAELPQAGIKAQPEGK